MLIPIPHQCAIFVGPITGSDNSMGFCALWHSIIQLSTTDKGNSAYLEAVTTHYVNKGSLKPKNIAHALLGKVMAYGFGQVLKQSSIIPLEGLCNELMDDAFGQDFIDQVDTIIKDLPKLRNTRDSKVMAQKLIDLLIQQQQTTQPPTTQQQSQQQQGKFGNATSASGNQQQQARTQDDTGNSQGQSVQSGKQQQKADKNQASGAGGFGAGSGGSKRPSPEEIQETLNNKTGYGDLSALIQSELNTLALSVPDSDKGGIPQLPDIGRLTARHGKLNEVEAISASSRMRARLMGLLQSIKMQPKSYGLSGRKLATGRLVKLVLGDPRIFRKKQESREVNTAVTVLLDLSGSMQSKYQVANAAAYALHLTLYGLQGVAVCSLEFSAKDKEPEVNVLVNFGIKPKSENFNHHPFDGTPTDKAIWAARALLLQRPEPRKIMLILTDGCPDNGAATQAATQRTVKDGIEIAAIGIVDKSVCRYWDNHKVINSVQELPAAMFGVMEGLLTNQGNLRLKGRGRGSHS